jgi:hypothetical protein
MAAMRLVRSGKATRAELEAEGLILPAKRTGRSIGKFRKAAARKLGREV